MLIMRAERHYCKPRNRELFRAFNNTCSLLMGGRAVPIIKYLQCFSYAFAPLFLSKVIEITTALTALYPPLFLSLKSFKPVVQLNAFERFIVQFQSYQVMIFISAGEVTNDEQ